MMAFVASVTFLLPLLALRWTNRYAWPELAGAGIIGGAAGWLCAVLLSSRAPLWMILLSAAVGAVAFAGGASATGAIHEISSDRSVYRAGRFDPRNDGESVAESLQLRTGYARFTS